MKTLQYLKEKIDIVIKEKFGTAVEYDMKRPPAETGADYALNAAFVLAKAVKKNPSDCAAEIASELAKDAVVEKAEAVKGYVNITVRGESLKNELLELLKGDGYFKNNSGAGKKINLEFVSANPVGPLNVVSGRAAAYGDTLANLYRFSGYEVTKEFYVNDHGRQMLLFARSLRARYFELHKKPFVFPEEGYQGEYVREVAAQIDTDREEAYDEIMAAFELGQEHDVEDYFKLYGLEYMKNWQKTTLENFGVVFDLWFSETGMHVNGEVNSALEEFRKKGAMFTQDGAEWLNTQKFGDDKDRVIKKQDGEYTYLASDIAYMKNKFARGADIVVNILGPDHHGYIKRLEAIALWLEKSIAQIRIIILQQVNLLEAGEKAKMSKREGKFVTLDELLDSVGKDAARYYFIMRNYNSHLDFDINLAKEQSEKNPVFYAQYGYARVCHIFSHAEEKHVFIEDCLPEEIDLSRLEKEERALILYMQDMPGFIMEAGEKQSPSMLVQNIYDLVSKFHSFYNKHRVVSEDKSETLKRLFIMKALKQTLKVCFGIIGITAREKM